jgi:hypothetical protein
MKLQTYRAMNIVALCLLLFAGYLNFFKKDKDAAAQPHYKIRTANPSRGTVLISNPEQYLKTHAKSETTQTSGFQN